MSVLPLRQVGQTFLSDHIVTELFHL